MNEPTHYSLAAASYARAILELAEEQHISLDSISLELDAIRQIIAGDDAFRLYLADPAIGGVEREALLKRVFASQLNPIVMHTIGVMNDKGRLSLLAEVADAYDALLDEKLGKIEVDLYVAQKLSPDEVEQARRQISESLKRDAVVHVYVDESLIGGAMLRIGDKLIDGSVKQQLKTIRDALMSTRPQ